MAINIHQIVSLNKQGKRKYNQDAIFPRDEESALTDRIFMVCDGVGGGNRGEIASQIVSECFPKYALNLAADSPPIDLVDQALMATEQRLTDYIDEHPHFSGTSTTLTFLMLDEANHRALIAWVGDSRVYHIRNGEILYQTEDHSLVNELVKRGELSEEEAKYYPQRNIILRAVSGKDKATKADTYVTYDLQEGDYFLLCTDGILEGVDNRVLTTLLGKSDTNLASIKDQINQFCEESANDNYSMYLVQLGKIMQPEGWEIPLDDDEAKTSELKWDANADNWEEEENDTAKLPPISNIPDTDATTASLSNDEIITATPPNVDDRTDTAKDSKNSLTLISLAALFLTISILGYFLYRHLDHKKQEAIDYKTHYDMAEDYAKENNFEAARAHYQKALNIYGDIDSIQKKMEYTKTIEANIRAEDSIALYKESTIQYLVKYDLTQDTLLNEQEHFDSIYRHYEQFDLSTLLRLEARKNQQINNPYEAQEQIETKPDSLLNNVDQDLKEIKDSIQQAQDSL